MLANSKKAKSCQYHGSLLRLMSTSLCPIGATCPALYNAAQETGQPLYGATVLTAGAAPAFTPPAAFAPGGTNCALTLNLISSPGGCAMASVWVLTISTDFLK